MSGQQVKLGEPLLIEAQLQDNITDKFIRAIVKDSDGAEVTGSPLTLTHVSNGFYQDNSLIKEDGSFSVYLQVFDDAGFTTPSKYDEGVLNFSNAVGGTGGGASFVEIEVLEPDAIELDLDEPDEIGLDITDDTIELEVDCE